MTLDLTKAKELAEKAWRAPWRYEKHAIYGYDAEMPHGQKLISGIDRNCGEFIAFSRAFVPEAIEEIERLRAALHFIASIHCHSCSSEAASALKNLRGKE